MMCAHVKRGCPAGLELEVIYVCTYLNYVINSDVFEFKKTIMICLFLILVLPTACSSRLHTYIQPAASTSTIRVFEKRVDWSWIQHVWLLLLHPRNLFFLLLSPFFLPLRFLFFGVYYYYGTIYIVVPSGGTHLVPTLEMCVAGVTSGSSPSSSRACFQLVWRFDEVLKEPRAGRNGTLLL